MMPNQSCNIMSKADSMIKFTSDQLVVQYWIYQLVPKGMTYADYVGGVVPPTQAVLDDSAGSLLADLQVRATSDSSSYQQFID